MDLNENKTKKKQFFAEHEFLLLGILLVIITAAGILYMGRGQGLIWNCKMLSASSVVLVLLLTIVFYMCDKNIEQAVDGELVGIKSRRQYSILLGCSYLLSFGGIVCSQIISVYVYWMVGGFLIAIVLNPYMGAIFQIYFSLMHAVILQQSIGDFAIIFLIAFGFCFLAPYLRKISSVGYVVMLSLACNGMSIILENNFNLAYIISVQSIWSELSMFLTIVGSAFFAWLFREYMQVGNFSFVRIDIQNFLNDTEDENLWQEGNFVRISDMEPKEEKEDTLSVILDEEFKLRKELKEQLPQVAAHSEKVAVLGELAAKAIGADEQLVYAGGLYHEVGRLLGKDYVKNSVQLAKEQNFPVPLVQIIEEHNVTCKLPSSREAAILMLTDSVIFMMERMDTYKQEKTTDIGALIGRVFELRFEKGELDDSQLTIKDYKNLQKTFQQWAQEQKKGEKL